MGSVGIGNNADLGAFLNRTHPEGLDLGRCQIKEALGVFVADPTSTFRAGMAVMRNASGLVVAADLTDFLGIAKWNHANTTLAVAVDEAIVLTGTTAVSLKNGNVSNVRVALAKAGGTTKTVTTDYTVSAANGTITRVGAGTIADGATVYVTYTYQLTEAQMLGMQGKNFWNSMDEVSVNEGRVTVITDAELIYTSQYDTSVSYATTGLTSNLYTAGGANAGLLTSATGGKFVGRVFQVPTAADPFLGFRLVKQVVQF
jgi:hypothetical protein